MNEPILTKCQCRVNSPNILSNLQACTLHGEHIRNFLLSNTFFTQNYVAKAATFKNTFLSRSVHDYTFVQDDFAACQK